MWTLQRFLSHKTHFNTSSISIYKLPILAMSFRLYNAAAASIRAAAIAAELGTFGIFEFFNNKKLFICIFIKLISYFCTSPI